MAPEDVAAAAIAAVRERRLYAIIAPGAQRERVNAAVEARAKRIVASSAV
jgi:hypothetical protein